MTHHHTGLELWCYFLLGQALHILKLAQSDKAGFAALKKHFQAQWLTIAIRLFLCSMLFSFWLTHPDAMTKLLSGVGISFDFTLEPGHATAGLFGFGSDSLIDYFAAKIPWLKPMIPTDTASTIPPEKTTP